MKIFRRLVNDFVAIASLGYILICAFVSIFAYVLAPDNTRNANVMNLAIHSKPPLFSIQILEIPSKNNHNNWYDFLLGNDHVSRQVPIFNYRLTETGIYYQSDKDFVHEQFVPFSDFSEQEPSEVISKYIKNKTFWLGTDKYGRDLLSRILIGTRISFLIGLIAVSISLLIGVFMGALSGFYGGMIDRIVLWVINVVWSIPTLLLVIAFTLVLGKGYWQVFIAVGFTMWVEIARIVRGQVISLKQMQYIEATKVLGYCDFRIIVRHILPNIFAPLIIISASNFASAILIESGLSFLGIGTQPPTPSWGGIIKDHYNYIILGKPFLAIIPGVAIMLLVTAFMLLGNRLRDILSVR